jgi:hypothetical protein
MTEFKKIEIKQDNVLYQSIAIHLKTETEKAILRWVIFEIDIQFEPTTFCIESLGYMPFTSNEMPNWRMSMEVWTEVNKKYYQGKLIDPNERRPNGLKKIYRKEEITIVKVWEYVRRHYHILAKTDDEIYSLCEEKTLDSLWEYNKDYLKEYLIEGLDITPALIKPVYIKCACPEETISCPCCFDVFLVDGDIDDTDKSPRNIPDTCGHPICEGCFDKIVDTGNGLCPICRQDLVEPQTPTLEEYFDFIYNKAQDQEITTQTQLSLLLDMKSLIEAQIDEYGLPQYLSYDEECDNNEYDLIILIKEVIVR